MVQIDCKKILFIFAVMLCTLSSSVSAVTFKFDQSSNIRGGATVKSNMETNITALLNEIDRAGKAGVALNLTSIKMEAGAKERLKDFWTEASRFNCIKPSYVVRCLEDQQGYQVRNIPIHMNPVDNSYSESLNRELVISLNKSGIITGVRPAMQLQEDVSKIMTSETGAVTDVRKRREILKWVEDFRCYYNERNIKALEQIYSEDALIITGSVMTQRQNGRDGVRYVQKVNYKVQDKTTYINNLRRQFASKARLDVKFDHITVMKHNAKDNIYGVTLRQEWTRGSYHDVGWLFLLWDFTDEDHPQIHVRTWQPEQAVTTDGVFTLEDFFIP